MIKLFNQFGWAGYGMFWAIIEYLREENGRISFDNAVDLFSFELRSSFEECRKLISFLIDVELLKVEDNYIFSQRLMDNINRFNLCIEKKKKAAIKRWRKEKERRHSTPNDDSEDNISDSVDSAKVEKFNTIPEPVFNLYKDYHHSSPSIPEIEKINELIKKFSYDLVLRSFKVAILQHPKSLVPYVEKVCLSLNNSIFNPELPEVDGIKEKEKLKKLCYTLLENKKLNENERQNIETLLKNEKYLSVLLLFESRNDSIPV